VGGVVKGDEYMCGRWQQALIWLVPLGHGIGVRSRSRYSLLWCWVGVCGVDLCGLVEGNERASVR
jgi:hypothetical protein